MSSTREMLLRPALTGVIAGTAAGVLLGNAGELPILGMAVSPAVAIGASVAVGSLTASAFNQYVVPKIASGQQAQAFESGVIGAVVPGAAAVLTAHFLIGKMSSTSAMLQLGALGAGSEIAAAYVAPMIGF
jgi:hypothetical protein